METLKDLWASLVSGMRDRTTNPLTFAFAVSWSIWNYQLLVILMGDEKTEEKLGLIASLYPRDLINHNDTLLYPLYIALAYVYVYPLLGFTAIWTYRKYQVWTTNAVKEIEKTRTLSRQEADELTRRHEKERRKWEVESVNLSNQVGSLRMALAEAEEENAKLKSEQVVNLTQNLEVPDAPAVTDAEENLKENDEVAPPERPMPIAAVEGLDELSSTELKLLVYLSKLTEPHTAQYIAQSMRENFTLVEADLQNLNVLGLVQKSSRPPYDWSLSLRGKRMAVAVLKSTQAF